MALNKSGKVEIATILVYVLIAGAIAYVANFGGFQDTVNGFTGKSTPTPVVINTNTGGNAPLTDTSDCPTSGTSTLTVNVQDALSTTATTLYPEYYLFNGNQLIKEGVLSASANTISVSCGKDYKLLLVNTTALSGIYAKTVDVQARIAQQTVNAQVVQFGGAIINFIANPDDPTHSSPPNVTLVAGGGLKNFDISFKENETQKGFNRPIIMCQGNVTTIKGINLIGFSDGTKQAAATLPKRITASSGYAYYVWEYPKLLDQTMGAITAHMTIEPTATAPSVTGTLTDVAATCKIADQAMWKTNKYKTASSIEEGFKTSAENTDSSNADVGAYDSAAVTLYYDGRGF